METENEKKYELRTLTADDIFPMLTIVSKVGVKEFKSCFESEDVKSAVAGMVSGDNPDGMNAVGLTVAFDLAGIIVSKLPNCKTEIFSFLASLSGIKPEEVAALPMGTFFTMILDVIKKAEFKDFFQVVSKSFR